MGASISVYTVTEANGRRVVARKQNKSQKCLGMSFTKHVNAFISVKASNYEMEEVMV